MVSAIIMDLEALVLLVQKGVKMGSLQELFQTIAVLICTYGICKLALSKKLKSFHIHFSVFNGFDISATYDNIPSEVTDNEE